MRPYFHYVFLVRRIPFIWHLTRLNYRIFIYRCNSYNLGDIGLINHFRSLLCSRYSFCCPEIFRLKNSTKDYCLPASHPSAITRTKSFLFYSPSYYLLLWKWFQKIPKHWIITRRKLNCIDLFHFMFRTCFRVFLTRLW